MKLSKYIDHAVLKPELSMEEAKQEILNGIKMDVKGICVRPCDLSMAATLLEGSDVYLVPCLDFPHGLSTIDIKLEMAKKFLSYPVQEIDMVMNYGLLRSRADDIVEAEIREIATLCHQHHVALKVIFEVDALTDEEIIRATEIAIRAGADYTKSSTGFFGGGKGATVEKMAVMLDAAKGRIKVKASGGIKTQEQMEKLIAMGVDRIGAGSGSTATLIGVEAADLTKESY